MGFLGSVERLQLRSVCDPAKIFLTSKFSYLLFFFPTQTHRTKTGTANRWKISNYTKPPSTNMDQQSDHIYYTLL